MELFLDWLEAFNATRNVTVNDPQGNAVQFVAKRPKTTIIIVNLSKILPYYQASYNYVVRGNKNEIEDRIDNFGNWFNKRVVPIEAPEAYFSIKKKTRNNYGKDTVPEDQHTLAHQVVFHDGRHRFAWMIEQGWQSIPIAVPFQDAPDFQAMFA